MLAHVSPIYLLQTNVNQNTRCLKTDHRICHITGIAYKIYLRSATFFDLCIITKDKQTVYNCNIVSVVFSMCLKYFYYCFTYMDMIL
jgi:hypothetical protein